MGTIVQEYGPIYGEVVNGTVSGRPNGSVFVPMLNTITLEVPADYRYIRYNSSNQIVFCASDGTTPNVPSRGAKMAAVAQDLASFMQLQLYEDSDLENIVTARNQTAGQFNYTASKFMTVLEDVFTDGQPLYLRVQLINNGAAIATSDVIEVEFVIP